MAPSLPTLAHTTLLLQLTLGALSRLPPTSTLPLLSTGHAAALTKYPTLRQHLPLPLAETDETHSRMMGATMGVAGALLCLWSKGARVSGAVVAGALLGSWVGVFWREGWEWYVPAVNVGICGFIVYHELR